MNFYVKEIFKNNWANPFPIKKYGINESLRLYKKYIYEFGLINNIIEFKNNTLGCWCKLNKYRGDILIECCDLRDFFLVKHQKK
jgi:hypothetical protein